MSASIIKQRFSATEKAMGAWVVWSSGWRKLRYSVVFSHAAEGSYVLEYEGYAFIVQGHEGGYTAGILPSDGTADGVVLSRPFAEYADAMRIAKVPVLLGSIGHALDEYDCCVFDLLADAIEEVKNLDEAAKCPWIRELAVKLGQPVAEVVNILGGLREEKSCAAAEVDYGGTTTPMWPLFGYGAD